MKLTAEMVESLSGIYLSTRYDQPQPTPEFHRECWSRYCGDSLACATAAPRSHAKSTALTHDYTISTVCFRSEDYVIIVGASEEKAAEHLNDITTEFSENEELIRDFKIKGFLKCTSTDIIVECHDKHQFRIMARGAEQKIRGTKWRGRRPGLIIGDDLEDDEQVDNKDRRAKFRRWFFRACKQALRRGGKIRVHGTILHVDSLLAHLMRNKSWNSRCYKAHRAFQDFESILWPEQFPESRLRAIRQEFMDEGDSAGYSQEYLNDPRDNDDAYIRKEQFIEMKEPDYECYKQIGVGVDLAISKADKANRTSFSVGGKDSSNLLHYVDQRVGRWDALEIVDEFFSIQSRWNPEVFFVEDGVIWKAVAPMLQAEMRLRDIWLNIVPILPVKDKATRGRPFQKRMKAGGARFDKQASWYPEFEEEILLFTGVAEAMLDDQFDSAALLARGFETWEVTEEDSLSDDEIEFELQAARLRGGEGRSAVTGY